jgi:UDP-GlcNAc:undecaprenyl-phosphate/decaprenyl-phosphate GlcNAc-1-phosphate transferase
MHSSLLILIGFVTATAFSMALVPMVLKFAGTFQLYDIPDLRDPSSPSRKIHVAPVPRLGGVAIVLSFFLTQIIWLKSAPLPGVLLGGFAVFLLGVADDIISIRPAFRFVLQILFAGFAVRYHDLVPRLIDFGVGIYLPVPYEIGFSFAIFVIVGAINTINMIDGLDGLAGGLALIGVALLSFLCFLKSQDLGLLLFIACPMIGAIVGFLRYNTHPAVVFMGDGGSNWLGFMIGSVMLLLLSGRQIDFSTSTLVPGAALPLVSVVLCLAIPVLDTAMVMVGRMRRGSHPMQADKTHLHHALLKIGLSHPQTVSALYFLGLMVGVIGILPVAFPNYSLDLAPYVGLLLVFSFVLVASRVNADAAIGFLTQRAKIRDQSEYQLVTSIIQLWENTNRYILYTILLAGPAFAGAVRMDVGIAGAAVSILILASIVLTVSRHGDDFLDSTCIALASTVLLVANNSNRMMVAWNGAKVSIQPIYNGLFGLLMVSTILLFIVTAKKRYFIFKPSDFLFATIPLILLLVPEPFRSEYRINIISLRSIVVFAAVRTLVKRKGYVIAHIKGVTLLALTFVFLAGVYGLRIVY